MSYEGILSQISLGKESVLGTPVTPTVSVSVLPSDGVVIEEEAVGVQGIDTQPALNKEFVAGLREYNGVFELNAYPQVIGYLLQSALGASDVVEAEAGVVYTHTFTEAVAKTGLTLEQVVGGETERFAGFVVSKLTIDIAVGESVRLTFEGKALSKADATKITPTYEVSKVFDWTDVQSITLGGTDIKAGVNQITVEYMNGLSNFHGLAGSTDPSYMYVQNSEVTGSISATLDANMVAQKDAFEAKTQQALVITLTADETIGSASNNELVITVPKVVLNTFTHPVTQDYVAVSIDYVARQDDTDGLIKVELTNLVASY